MLLGVNGALIIYVNEDLVGCAIKLLRLEDNIPYYGQKTFIVYVR